MKYNNKEETLKEVVELYLQGKTMEEISEKTGWSRNYIGQCLKNVEEVKEFRNKRTVSTHKRKNINRIDIQIPNFFWEKIGISTDNSINDKIDIMLNENNKTITIKKHKNR